MKNKFKKLRKYVTNTSKKENIQRNSFDYNNNAYKNE